MTQNHQWTAKAWNTICHTIEQSEHHYRPEFVTWLHSNHQVWQAFVDKTHEAFNLQHRARFSARNVMEQVRWSTAVRESGAMFKINNNYIPDLARLVMELDTRLNGFYQLRSNPEREQSVHKA